jgi:hypothetical protein
MGVKAVKDMMAVLPHRLDYDKGGMRRDGAKDFHAALLAIDEAVAFGGIASVASFHHMTEPADGLHNGLFDAGLGRPTLPVGGEPQVATGD